MERTLVVKDNGRHLVYAFSAGIIACAVVKSWWKKYNEIQDLKDQLKK